MREIRPKRPKSGDQWLKSFLTSLRKEDLAPGTIRGYQNDLEHFVRWFEESRGRPPRLEEIAEIDIMNYRGHLLNVRRLKPATVNRRLEALRRVFRWAHHCGITKTNVAHDIKSVRTASRRRPVGLLGREVHALLRVAGGSRRGLGKRNYAIVQLMLQAGLRVGEVAALRMADVTLRDRTGFVRIRQGKGRKEREVPLNTTVRRALRLYLKTRDSVGPDDPLFLSREGNSISVRSIQTLITELARRAKILRIKVSAHTTRHTFALGYLKRNPGKLVELASLLGHDSIDTTAIYVRPSAEELAEDLERSPLNVY